MHYRENKMRLRFNERESTFEFRKEWEIENNDRDDDHRIADEILKAMNL